VDVVRTLRLALSGASPATVHEPGERQPLVLRIVLARADRSGPVELSRLQVKGQGGGLVPLAEIGHFEERTDDLTITHKDLDRAVFVLGDVAGRPPADVILALEADLARRPLGDGVTATWTGEGEWQITLDVFRDLGFAFLVACLAIYALLVMETRSFLLPLVIMLSIPLGVIGIMPGFWLLNRLTAVEIGGHLSPVWFTATGMIGMIALAGIVIRNGIILIDFIRSRVAEGQDVRQAVMGSGAARLRPILLTAAAAMLGAWPITLDPIFSGLAWSLIFGIVASTAFTLVVIPVVFHALYAAKEGTAAPPTA
jgi:multidrug efflux pump subunit AcrB